MIQDTTGNPKLFLHHLEEVKVEKIKDEMQQNTFIESEKNEKKWKSFKRSQSQRRPKLVRLLDGQLVLPASATAGLRTRARLPVLVSPFAGP